MKLATMGLATALVFTGSLRPRAVHVAARRAEAPAAGGASNAAARRRDLPRPERLPGNATGGTADTGVTNNAGSAGGRTEQRT